jgi:hypothetical protein
MQRVLFSVGMLSVGLAAAGLVLPLLPTTPFLLLAGACFARSSDRHYQRLMNHPAFGPILRRYREHRAISRKVKIATLVLLWGTIGPTAIFVASSLALRVVLLSIAAIVTVFILRHRSEPESAADDSRESTRSS